MPLFDECCVLIPTATLEDFPSDLSDYDARSLLAAWTVLWDPRLLAQTEQLPVGDRAEAEDVIQDTFVAALADLPKLRDPASVRTWMIDIAVHRVKLAQIREFIFLRPTAPLTPTK